jgi:hypothetical protein
MFMSSKILVRIEKQGFFLFFYRKAVIIVVVETFYLKLVLDNKIVHRCISFTNQCARRL